MSDKGKVHTAFKKAGSGSGFSCQFAGSRSKMDQICEPANKAANLFQMVTEKMASPCAPSPGDVKSAGSREQCRDWSAWPPSAASASWPSGFWPVPPAPQTAAGQPTQGLNDKKHQNSIHTYGTVYPHLLRIICYCRILVRYHFGSG